ncbi:MAG TPA: SIMPL domain-containing protein [bacterium]|jgi:hypothetical protein
MNGNDRFLQLFWGLVAVAVGFVLTGLLVSGALRAIKRANDNITVTGSARRTVRSDYVEWNGNYAVNDMSMQHGYETITRNQQRIRQWLNSRRISDSLIVFSGVHTRDMTRSKRNAQGEYVEEFIGYQLTQSFQVHSTQVDSIEAIARDISQLTAESLPVNSDPPQFYFTALAPMRMEMLSEATKDARTRAEQIAGSAGGRVRSLRNARQGVFQVTAPNSREVRDYGIYDTSTIEKDITAVVSVTFSVN